MTEKPWHERMNDEYAACKTDAERMTVLGKYMGPDEARAAFAAIEGGASSGVRDESEPKRKGGRA